MKKVKELDLHSLTAEQKLGLVFCANLNHGPQDVENALQMIREHRLGAVWVTTNNRNRDEILKKVRKTADYPILIFCDAENGPPGYSIPGIISLSAARENEAYAHSFGRLTSAVLSRMGYNVVCNPVLDRCSFRAPCGANTRSISPDKEVTARLSAAVIRGMHEGGTLSVAKHYPSEQKKKPYDSHMREGYAEDTREELLADALYPYRKLIAEGLLDGVMVGHSLLPSIDPEYPASLSRPVMDILRECGFDGFYISDGLNMMGVVLKYGNYAPTPMALGAGCDLPLPWGIPCREAYRALEEAYRDGRITDAQLDLAVSHVLDAQHKVTLLPEPEILAEDIENIARLNRECISAVCEEGLSPSIDPMGKHLFVIMTDMTANGNAAYDAFATTFYSPDRIAEKIKELFPNSDTFMHPEYPSYEDNMRLFGKQQQYDDIVYITYYKSFCFIGRECLTQRTVDMMDALQSTDRIVAHLHFGSPFVATDAPYIPRVLLGWASAGCVMHTLECLAGKAEVLGVQPYANELKFHKKGDLIS